MDNIIDKTVFWMKINEDFILNLLAYAVAPLLVIGLVAWISFA
ncbi:MAG: hypothetical protein NTZ51_02740 [Proteobacteria bacterium]|nr:hypothetical protein [Pseudomonadota bacterium]